MVVNEEARQVELAEQLSDIARSLAHSTRDVPNPSDSYRLLGALTHVQDTLIQVYDQLSKWHAQTVDGLHYAGEDPADGASGPRGTAAAAELLHEAAERAADAGAALSNAHGANAVVRWFPSPRG